MKRFNAFVFATLVAVPLLVSAGWLYRNRDAPVPDPELLQAWVQEDDLPSPYPSSPHREDSEEYAAFSACRRLLDAPEVVALRTKYLAALKSSPSHRRAIVAGCLQDTAAVELLVTLAESNDQKLAEGAIRALGFFGEAPRVEDFLTYGGRGEAVEFPAVHDARATAALLNAYKRAPAGVRWRVVQALRTHRGPEVIDVAVSAAGDPSLVVWATLLLRELACGDVCRSALEQILAKDSTAASLAAGALADSHDPAAAEPLLRALEGPSAYTRESVARQLWVFARLEFPYDGANWSADVKQLQAAWRARLAKQPAPPELVEAAKAALEAGEAANEAKKCDEAREALLQAAVLGTILDQPSIAGASAQGLGRQTPDCPKLYADEDWYRFALEARRKTKAPAEIRDSASALGSTLYRRRAVPDAEAAYAEAIAAAESLQDFESSARFHGVMAALWAKASEGEIRCAPRCKKLTPRLDSDEERRAREHYAQLAVAAKRAGLEKAPCAITRLAPERCAQLERKP